MWVLLRLPQFGGAKHAGNYDYRSRYRQVGIPGHGVDVQGQVVIRCQLKRRYVLAFFQKLAPCLVGIEACASSHHWSRELKALGHTVRLMPPAYVKPYVKRQKNDAADAEAICEAVTRVNMRFVATKTPEQQSCLMLHRTRHLFIRQQTSVINVIRAHCRARDRRAGRPQGCRGVARCRRRSKRQTVPEVARACLAALGAQLRRLKEQILEFDRIILAWHRSSETSRRLDAIPALVDAGHRSGCQYCRSEGVRSGRNFSAWIGLVPKQHSSGAKTGSVVSASKAIAICAACSWPARWPSFAMPRSMAPSIGLGSRHCWRAAGQGRCNRARNKIARWSGR